MSAQPDHALITQYASAPGVPAEIFARLRADRRADTWVPAFPTSDSSCERFPLSVPRDCCQDPADMS
ncbi:hypothetical protein ACFV0H_33170 [Streptomyces erythrochromogenes]|uniref:Uncharacterized protein n=1 Tax=Streptomyces erythrochromogenes TaxID=285574 RepID=A0ABZ1Q2W9_9ACTN|nr:hypothetical protein [Streptomyces erythrochromogenes]